EQRALQRRLYGAASDAEVAARFRDALAQIPSARAVLLAVPSDVGAGFLRGANVAPQAMRTALLRADPAWPERAAAAGLVDVGDVFVVPQLLHDDMLGEAQKAASRAALYLHSDDGAPGRGERALRPDPQLDAAAVAHLPVSPLSIAERALDLV